MLGKVLKAAGRAAVFRRLFRLRAAGTLGTLLILSAVAAEFFAKRGRIRSGKLCGDVYVIGKKSHPKAVCVTNISPVKSAINVIKRHFNS